MSEAALETPPARTSPFSARRSLVFDVALVAALLLLGLVMQVAAAFSAPSLGLTLAQILPLLLRRTHPTLSFTLVAGATALQVPLADVPTWGQLAMPIAVYSVTAYAPREHARVALVVALAGGVVGPMDWLGTLTPDTVYSALGLIAFTELMVIAPWALGALTRTRQAYVAELIDRGRRLELEAAQRAELAASEERARIAREMHDVVAHGLSVMVVQADGARYAAERDPAAATAALETIGATGREALAEMRRMLGLLRADDTTGVRPQPGLVDLEILLAEASGSGMHLTTDLEQPLPQVSGGTGLTVYRVVQEALTNVRKHAGPDAQVHVAVQRLGRSLRVGIQDDGHGATARDDGEGHGLVGMRERVVATGGALEAGPRPGGGYRVEALVPIDPRDPEVPR